MNKNVDELNRSLGFWSALALVIGTIIGAGVFIRQAAVMNDAGSPALSMLAWLLGGLITLASGLSISEIASQIPETGGLYVYMNSIYGRFWGFLSGWMQIIVYGPAMIASLGAYLGVLVVTFFNLSSNLAVPIGILTVVSIGILNFFSSKYGARFAVITTICKLAPILALVLLGIIKGENNAVSMSVAKFSQNTSNFGVAILATLFAFDGWILVANMGGEIKNAKKRLPQAIIGGISSVLIIYLLVAFATFKSVTPTQMHEMGTGIIPYIAIQGFGDFGGKVLSVGIIVSIIGCMNGKIMAFPRIMFAMARKQELPFPNQIGYLNHKSKTPIIAIVITIVIASLMIAFTDADRLSELCIFTVYCFYIFAFIGLFKLRKNSTEQTRPFSVPLFPFIPILAICGSLYVNISEIINDPVGVAFSFVLVASGIPVYLYCKKS